jgi:hypothetical protein
MRGVNASYVTKDATGNNVYTTTTPGTAGITGDAFDITSLDTYKMGYNFQAGSGDIIKIYLLSGQSMSLAITGQDGNWITTEYGNLGSLSASTKFLFEIYTPYRPSASEPYYEMAQIFPVLNPTLNTRAYSVTAGNINGDVTLLNRNDSVQDYLTEAMSPNDKQYQNWNTDIGRPNFVDTIGQVKRTDSVAYSNTFVSNTKVNGLSTFDPLDVKDISSDYGAIMKLQLTSKVQKTGSIMLAICAGSETASLYLSEHTLMDNTGNTSVIQTDDVIGTVNTLKGERGTLNPESVTEYKGQAWWFDAQNGKWVQYADNGLFDISNYKTARFWKLFADQYKSMTPQQIEALGDRPFVVSGIDPHHNELLCSVPRTLQDPPKGYLPDYPSMPYPFDIWDGRGKTLVFKLLANPNKWDPAQAFVPEFMFYLEDNVFGFRNGQMYQFNQPQAQTTFFGQKFKARVMLPANQMPSKPKAYNNVALECNQIPSLSYFYTNYPWLQATDILDFSYEDKEGQWYAPLQRNKLDPKYWPDTQTAQLRGEKMRTVALLALYEFDVPDNTYCEVRFLNFGFSISLGHTT